MKYLFVLISFFIVSYSNGQSGICGTRDSDGSIMRRLDANKEYLSRISLRADTPWIFIPIQFHVVTDGNGAGGVDENQLLTEMDHVNYNYKPHKIKFYLAGDFNYVKYEVLYNNPGDQYAEAKMKSVKNQKALNIFVVNNMDSGSSAGTVLGYYTNSIDVLVIRKTQFGVNSQTVSHEIGHFLSLQHPFYGWEETPYDATVHGNPVKIKQITTSSGTKYDIELMDKSNCASAADKICDTPPDYNFGLFDDGDCKLNGPILDYNHDTIVMMENNYMSYFFGCGVYKFTPTQVSLMRADYNSSKRSSIRTGVIPDTLSQVKSSFAVVYPAENQTTDYYDLVLLDWSDVTNAKFYLVAIYPLSSPSSVKRYIVNESKLTLTDLSQNKRYGWTVYPYSNGSFNTGKIMASTFKTGLWLVGTDEMANSTGKFVVYPNPSNGNEIYVHCAEDFDNADIKVTDMFGKVLIVKKLNLSKGENQIQLNISVRGMYSLLISKDNKQYINKIIIK